MNPMKKVLVRKDSQSRCAKCGSELHWPDCRKLRGDVTGLRGDVSGLRGDVSGLSGNVSGLRGDVSGLSGNVTGLRGDVSGLSGNVTGLSGNVDDAKLSEEDRKKGINITELVVSEKSDL